MAKKLYDDSNIIAIANKLRTQHGNTDETFKTSDMAGAIWIPSPFGLADDELVLTNSEEVAISSTSLASSFTSTSATSIRAVSNSTSTVVLNLTNYDYYVRVRVLVPWVYTTAVTKAAYIASAFEAIHYICRRANTDAHVTAGTLGYNATTATTMLGQNLYYNTSGTKAVYTSSSYGLYPSLTAPVLSSTSSATPTLTLRKQALYARCNTSYCSSSAFAGMNRDSTKFIVKQEVYRTRKGGYVGQIYADLAEMLKNKTL